MTRIGDSGEISAEEIRKKAGRGRLFETAGGLAVVRLVPQDIRNPHYDTLKLIGMYAANDGTSGLEVHYMRPLTGAAGRCMDGRWCQAFTFADGKIINLAGAEEVTMNFGYRKMMIKDGLPERAVDPSQNPEARLWAARFREDGHDFTPGHPLLQAALSEVVQA